MRNFFLGILIFLTAGIAGSAWARETVNVRVVGLEFHDPDHLNQPPKAKLAPSAGVDQSDLDQLPESRCVWMGESEKTVLSWDGIARFQPPLDNNADSIDACTNRQPGSGLELTIDGHHFDLTGFSGASSLQTCIASSASAAPPNRFNECRTPRFSCYDMPQICPSDTPDMNFPLCQRQCVMSPWPVNFTYKMESEPLIAAGGQTASAFFSPSFTAVQSMESLSRRMTFSARDSNLDTHEYAWTWSVPSLPDPDGRWEENFSPQLMVTGVKAFILNPNSPGGIQYLTLQASKPVRVNGVSFQPCVANPEDGTEANGDSCPPMLEATPGYLHRTIGTKITWLLKISGAPEEPGNKGLNESSEVYVRFRVTNKLQNPGRVTAYPSRRELGSYEPGSGSHPLADLFKIDNTHTAQTWTVETIRVDGANASEFAPAIMGGRNVPFSIQAGGSVHFGAIFTPVSSGEKSAVVHVTLRDASGSRVPFSGEMHAWARPRPHAAVVPASLSLKKTRGNPDIQNIEIQNTGTVMLARGEIVIKGGDSNAFQVFGAQGNQPPPATATIRPGAKEIIRVSFVPTAPLKANYQSRLRVTTNAGGDKFVDLKGKA